MYQAPDFVKVSTKVKDVFSSYGSCPMDGYYYYSHTGDPQTCNEKYNDNTFIGLGRGYMCYSTNDAPDNVY